jgi:aspartyl-tRNA(Asn)/glutamyl-tRNA(Gln) amidotransferase subunit A
MTRSVEDAALLYNAMQGPDPQDPLTRGVAFEDPLPKLKRGVAGLKLAIMPADERKGVDPEVLAAFDASIETLRTLGAHADEVSLPRPFAAMAEMTGDIIGAEGYHFVGDLVDDMSLPIDEAVRPRIWRGRGMTARAYLDTLKKRRAVQRDFDTALAGYDALLTPTTATPAPPIDAIDQSTSPAGFTRLVNVLDRCALAVPNGFTAGGLPTSLHIVCNGYDEATALRIGWAYEQATDWRARRPLL